MRRILEEIPWILVSIVLSLGISYFLGARVFTSDNTIDINIYDTYFVFESVFLWLFILITMLFIVYIFRVIRLNYKSQEAFLILVVAGMALIVFLTKINSFGSIITSSGFDRFSSSTTDLFQQEIFQIWKVVSNIFLGVQTLTVVILVLVAFKFGRNI